MKQSRDEFQLLLLVLGFFAFCYFWSEFIKYDVETQEKYESTFYRQNAKPDKKISPTFP